MPDRCAHVAPALHAKTRRKPYHAQRHAGEIRLAAERAGLRRLRSQKYGTCIPDEVWALPGGSAITIEAVNTRSRFQHALGGFRIMRTLGYDGLFALVIRDDLFASRNIWNRLRRGQLVPRKVSKRYFIDPLSLTN